MTKTRARICLVTTGQPSTNPRLVKEADALVDAGYQVHVVGAHWAEWADEHDRALLAQKRWTVTLVDWRRAHAPLLFHKTRVRHWAARHLAGTAINALVPAAVALSRVGPELQRTARSIPAALYIAHNIGALPAASAAARHHGVRCAFDAEDFHSGQLPANDPMRRTIEAAERILLPQCVYVTAASPGIAAAYHHLCAIPPPTTILNVFPLSERPSDFRQTDAAAPLRLYWFSQTIGPHRGLEDAVAAMGLLAPHDIELHLRGHWHDGYEQRLRTFAHERGVSPARIVAHPPAASTDMVRCAATYDVGLALEPSVSDNNDIAWSNKVFTYLLAGTATLMTRTTGQAALLPQLGEAAVGCDAKNPSSLAGSLRRWLEDRQTLERARRAAWALGESTFNWDREKTLFLNTVGNALATCAHVA
ncbi:MAG: hypothetical protein LBQ09_06175 [Acidobacteriaceae bacterium]|nr:hypothetical protein [Acidobacteriaceae bacterium]